MSNSLQLYGLYPARLLCLWDLLGKNTGVVCHGDLLDPGIKPISFMSPALAGGFFTTSTIWEAHHHHEGPTNKRLEHFFVEAQMKKYSKSCLLTEF